MENKILRFLSFILLIFDSEIWFHDIFGKVLLDDYNIIAKSTATTLTGFHR